MTLTIQMETLVKIRLEKCQVHGLYLYFEFFVWFVVAQLIFFDGWSTVRIKIACSPRHRMSFGQNPMIFTNVGRTNSLSWIQIDASSMMDFLIPVIFVINRVNPDIFQPNFWQNHWFFLSKSHQSKIGNRSEFSLN